MLLPNRFLLFPLAIFTLFSALAVGDETVSRRKIDTTPGVGRSSRPTIPEVPRDEVICFALYTQHDGVLKLSAQLYPLNDDEPREVRLEVEEPDGWKQVGTTQVDAPGWLATFRVEKWDASRDRLYRVTHAGGSVYSGRIRRDPTEQDEIVVAAFTGNSNTDRGPRPDIVRNIQAQDPDLLFFSGDQSYDHENHLAAWLSFGRQFGEIIKDRPTITIPDDHDVGQGNIWGAGGKKAFLPGAADGGYLMDADYVKMVERAQTSHLPDPYDPTPIQQGIGVYYTSLNVGGVDFAIIEDRKWKTGPAGLIPPQGPRPDHITSPDYDPRAVDVPEAVLLGERQLKFLRAWGQDWTHAQLKTVLSQTIFAGGAHIHGKLDGRLVADLDSNGWPQAGRNRALDEMRRAFAFHIAGDQHLATVLHHGINSWEDSGYSFCVPPIVNYYGRWWAPLEKPVENPSGKRLADNPLEHTGRYYDGLGNKVSMHAYANPTETNHKAAGYGLIRFQKSTRQITMECWPRHVDVTQPSAQQFAGWPVTINQQENYARQAIAWLPTLKISGQTDPVVQVVDESSGDIVYTLRICGDTWRPKVFKEGLYTLHVGEADLTKTLSGISSGSEEDAREIVVAF